MGDSRIYLIRGGRIQQLTVDHTWVQEAIDKGILTPEGRFQHRTSCHLPLFGLTGAARPDFLPEIIQ